MKKHFLCFVPLALCFLFALAVPSRAALIVEDNFDSYGDGRLQTVSSSLWSSSTTTVVASVPGVAQSAPNYVELGVSNVEISGTRTFIGVPTTGIYWVQFSLEAAFTKENLSSTRPQLRISDGTNVLATILYRNDLDVMRINYSPIAGGTQLSIDTSVAYGNTGWHTFTFGINLDAKTASIYLDGQSVVSFSFDGYGSTFNTLNIRSLIPDSAPEGSALRLDSIGFYDANPIPEPSASVFVGGCFAVAFSVLVLRRRRIQA